jgi:GNAT superfamily N-acetyltransferase
MNIELHALAGGDIASVLSDLAQLRIAVFRDWPYLYDGSLEYEQAYLAKFARARGAVCVVARDGGRVVGASTGAPLAEDAAEFGEPFRRAGYDLSTMFYCGESVLLPAYRGRGVGKRFFDLREAHARSLGGFTHATFCRVVRPDDHPLKPAGYVPLDRFWARRGYAPVPGLTAGYDWKDVDQTGETRHAMQFWMKAL